MVYDKDRIDDMVLALLFLTSFDDGPATRAWKNHDWEVMDRLHDKGHISDPKSKAKSVTLSAEGKKLAEDLFKRLFRKE